MRSRQNLKQTSQSRWSKESFVFCTLFLPYCESGNTRNFRKGIERSSKTINYRQNGYYFQHVDLCGINRFFDIRIFSISSIVLSSSWISIFCTLEICLPWDKALYILVSLLIGNEYWQRWKFYLGQLWKYLSSSGARPSMLSVWWPGQTWSIVTSRNALSLKTGNKGFMTAQLGSLVLILL